MKAVEVVLPSGIFAAIRPPTFLDRLTAHAHAPNVAKAKGEDEGVIFLALIFQRCCTFDGERWPLERILELDGRDGMALIEAANPLMLGPIKSEP